MPRPVFAAISMRLRPPSRAGRSDGFSLAELLIAFVVIGLLAALTLPKVLSGIPAPERSKAIVKGAVAEVNKAYAEYRMHHTPGTSTNFNHITPYMNFVRWITTADYAIDREPNSMIGSISCGGGYRCLLLSSGALLMYNNACTFASPDTTSAVWFFVDPDGKAKQSAVSDSPTKSTHFKLYFDGRIKSVGTQLNNTCTSCGSVDCNDADPTRDPSYWNME